MACAPEISFRIGVICAILITVAKVMAKILKRTQNCPKQKDTRITSCLCDDLPTHGIPAPSMYNLTAPHHLSRIPLHHDAIMNAHGEEKMSLEEQTSQVAQRAAEALCQSRMLRSGDSISVPTWTGRSKTAGAPSSVRKRFGSTVNSQLVCNSQPSNGPSSSGSVRSNGLAAGASVGKALSSAELLNKIRGTQERAVSEGLEHQFGMVSSSSNSAQPPSDDGSCRPSQKSSSTQPEVLIRQICTFIQQRGGTTNSANIVEHFRNRIPSKDLPYLRIS